jgi:hypothetical protein
MGSIVGIFAGALDSVYAQLLRKIPLGDMVELLESKREFHKGDRVPLSVREFTMNKATWRRELANVHRGETADGAAVRHHNRAAHMLRGWRCRGTTFGQGFGSHQGFQVSPTGY